MHPGMPWPLSPVWLHSSQTVWTSLLLDTHARAVDWLEGEVSLQAPGHLVDLEAQALGAGRPGHASAGHRGDLTRLVFIKGDVKRNSMGSSSE